MRFGLSAKTVADVNDVKSSLITTRRIVFAPAQGNIVKRVTSSDVGWVEAPEDNGDDNGENEGTTPGTTPTNPDTPGGGDGGGNDGSTTDQN